jgi:hypothetical protein
VVTAEVTPRHEIRLDITTDEELAELEQAVLKARATELSEVRRRNVRLVAGYGDDTTRDVMDAEARLAQARYDVLTRLLEAIRDATEP